MSYEQAVRFVANEPAEAVRPEKSRFKASRNASLKLPQQSVAALVTNAGWMDAELKALALVIANCR
jgi:hypothetical protein